MCKTFPLLLRFLFFPCFFIGLNSKVFNRAATDGKRDSKRKTGFLGADINYICRWERYGLADSACDAEGSNAFSDKLNHFPEIESDSRRGDKADLAP